MCFGSGGSSQPAAPAATPTANPLLPQADPSTTIWNNRRRQQNDIVGAGMGTPTAANDPGSPATALKKLMGA